MKTKIRKIGSSYGVLLPKTAIARLGAKANDYVDVRVEGGALVITQQGHDPRAGWADEFKALTAVGEAGLVWPEFGNDGDKNWAW